MVHKNLYFLIELTARKIRKFGQEILNKHGINITIEQWLVLKTVSENQGINQLKIGELLLKDKPTISRMIRNLVKEGYVIKETSNTDLRQFVISLSPQGENLITDLYPIIENIRNQGLSKLTLQEKTELDTLLLKIQNTIDS